MCEHSPPRCLLAPITPHVEFAPGARIVSPTPFSLAPLDQIFVNALQLVLIRKRDGDEAAFSATFDLDARAQREVQLLLRCACMHVLLSPFARAHARRRGGGALHERLGFADRQSTREDFACEPAL